jgi:hypothetical protein
MMPLEIRNFTSTLAGHLLHASMFFLVAACSALPEFSGQPSAVNGLLSFDDLVTHIECEIANATQSDTFSTSSYAASISLSAEVSSTLGVAPGVAYINPLTGGADRSLSASGQYSTTNHKNLTKNFSILVNRERAEAVLAYCKNGAGSGIGGNLGLMEAIALGSNEKFLFQKDGDPKAPNNFVISVDFTITKGAAGGPSWNLTHFRGPADSEGKLINWTNVAKDTLIVSFVRVEPVMPSMEVSEEKKTENMKEAIKAAEDGLTRSLLERIVPGR